MVEVAGGPEKCGEWGRPRGRKIGRFDPAVVLMQISAHITHKNLTERKIVEAIRTAYAKK